MRGLVTAFRRRLVAVEDCSGSDGRTGWRSRERGSADKSACNSDFDGDESPAESGENSPHSKARAEGWTAGGVRNRVHCRMGWAARCAVYRQLGQYAYGNRSGSNRHRRRHSSDTRRSLCGLVDIWRHTFDNEASESPCSSVFPHSPGYASWLACRWCAHWLLLSPSERESDFPRPCWRSYCRRGRWIVAWFRWSIAVVAAHVTRCASESKGYR